MRNLSPRTRGSSKRTRVTPARLRWTIGGGGPGARRLEGGSDRCSSRRCSAEAMLEAEMTSELTERLRVATYNVHGCVGMDGQRSEGRIAEVIASMSADIVGLQELDLGRARSAHADQAAL